MGSNPPPDPTGAGQVTTGQQPTTPAPATSVAPSGAPTQSTTPQTYAAMQAGYYGPLNTLATPAMPQLDDPTMNALAQRIDALQQSHAVLSGQAPPDPNSVFARQTAHLTAAQIATQVGQETLQQSITQPFTDWVNTWKRDWKAGLMETLGGAALLGGIFGLEALTGGAATPFIFAAGAALVAPSMIQSWADEIQHPTDSNLVKALVATSTGIIAVGTPFKWAKGMTMGRNSLSFALRAKQEAYNAAKFAASIVSGRPELRDSLNLSRPIEEQLDVLGTSRETITAQFEQYNAGALKDKDLVKLMDRYDALKPLQQAWHAAKSAGDDVKLKELEAQMKAYTEEEILPLRLPVAAHFLFLADNRMSHVPLGPTEKTMALKATVQKAAQLDGRAIMGFIRQLGRMDNLSDISAQSLIEGAGRRGELRRTIAQMSNHHRNLVKTLGLSHDDIVAVELGIEDKEKWDTLSGEQQLYGQFRTMMHGAATLGELKAGTIPNAIAGYLPRMFEGVEETEHTAGVRDVLGWLRGAVYSNSRMYKAAVDANGEVVFSEKPRAQLMREQEQDAARYKNLRPLRDYHAQNTARVKAERATIAGFKRHLTRYTNLAERAANPVDEAKWRAKAEAEQAKIDRHWDTGMVSGDQKLTQLAHMESNQYETVQRIAPSMRKLITGTDLFDASMASYAFRMEEASIRMAMQSKSDMGVARIGEILGKKVALGKYGIEMQQPEFLEAHKGEIPDFMPESAFTRGKEAKNGWKVVSRAIGRAGDLNYRPAIMARDELADAYHAMLDNAKTSYDTFSGLSGLLYKTVWGSKRFIMASPFWHAMNVTGRLVAFALEDPVGAKTALSTVWGKGEHMLDPEMRAALEERARAAGLTHANQFEVTNLMHRNLRNDDAQPTWKHVLRTMAGPIPHVYQDMLEGGFWKMVDDMQLAGFQLAEHKMRLALPNASEAEISRLAAEYANNLAGMVNPLYMNRVYRHARNLIWFAPSYWATFTRMLLSAFPGADRMSGFLARYRGGQFVRFGAVPLKAVSESGRRELARMQRSWVTTYLATGVVAADMLNVMLGGRHLWENDQGRMFDINVDKFASWSHALPGIGGISPGGPSTLPSGEVQHTYISGIPFFRQAADVMNAMGFGHDYGLAHQFNDQTWEQADVLHKGLMAAGAAADGIRREAANKLGGVPQALYGGISGEELSSRLGTGTQRQIKGPIGSWDSLLSLVPGGLTAQRFWSAEAIAAAENRKAPPGIQLGPVSIPQSLPSQLVQQFTGFPTMYHMGPEQPPIDDSKMQAWYTERNALHDALQQASKQMFMGDMTPLGYARKRQQLLDRLVELDKVTFGNDTPAAALAGARADIAQKVGLDNLGLSDADWYSRYQTFQQVWDATLQSASPEARAAWWEHEHSQWTDADYLMWEAQEMKKAIAAAVDGQGGNYIAAFEHQIASLEALPLTTAERTKIEQSDPTYYTYRNVIRAMSRSSALGAFINAFTSPFSETYILEQGLTPAEQQQAALVAAGGASLITPQTAQQLAAGAKQLATSPDVTQAGGEATGSPQFQSTVQQLAEESAGQ